MIPEIGSILLALSLSFCILSCIYPLLGVVRSEQRLMLSINMLTLGCFVCLFGALICLIYIIVTNDFTVKYVIQNSSRYLPLYYKIASVWGGHEGSLLMWIFLMSAWSVTTAFFNNIASDIKVKALILLAFINSGFIGFTLLTSNPFERSFPFIPLEGDSLNPMLQNVNQIFHPPLIYLGYTGFSVVFAFSVISLITGRTDILLMRWLRIRVIISWIFLTGGILSGAYWAYHILGWGGWWFWDPVENASLMPWLAAVALIHSLYVTEKKQIFVLWTILLAIIVFATCLVGLFLVRSGILDSVHSFAFDSKQGLFFLFYIIIVIGSSLVLFACKGNKLLSIINENDNLQSIFSKKHLMLSGNVVLLSALGIVIFGTFSPLIYQLAGLGNISIGESFFNKTFEVLFVPLSILISVTPLTKWDTIDIQRIRYYLFIDIIISIILSFLIVKLYAVGFDFIVWLYLSLALFIITTTVTNLYVTLIVNQRLQKKTARYYGMTFAHLGISVMVIGIVFSQSYTVTKNISIGPGEYNFIDDYQLYFNESEIVYEEGFISEVITIHVYKKNKLITLVYPDKRFYPERNVTITNPAVYSSISSDLHIIPGEKTSEGSWTFRLYKKPCIFFIWFGCGLIIFGGVLCILSKSNKCIIINKECKCEK